MKKLLLALAALFTATAVPAQAQPYSYSYTHPHYSYRGPIFTIGRNGIIYHCYRRDGSIGVLTDRWGQVITRWNYQYRYYNHRRGWVRCN
jgi:hypothetical protein